MCCEGDPKGIVYTRDGVSFEISEFLDRAAHPQQKRARLCAIYGGAMACARGRRDRGDLWS